MKTGLRTPLATAKGLGSAKTGSHHWVMQRVTAIALIPLTIWFLSRIIYFAAKPWQATIIWAAKPFNTTLLILLVVSSFYHALLGLQIVIEDYVHNTCWKKGLLIGCKFTLISLGLLSIVFIIKIFLLGFVI